MTFRLSSINVATPFDDPVHPLVVPSTAAVGDSPALCMLDGANRAPHRLARLVRRVAMLGLRLQNPETGVRVTIRFLVDENSTSMWRRAHLDDEGEPVLEDEFGKHRLIEVSAQGRRRAAVLLCRERGQEISRGQVTFDLAAEEIDGSGIVMFGFEPPHHAPDWVERDLLEDSAVGVCIRSVQVEALPAEPTIGALSAGSAHQRDELVGVRPGFLVVNPGSESGPVHLSIGPARRGPRQVHGRRARLVEPLHQVRDLGARVSERHQSRGSVLADVVTMEGAALPVVVESGEDGRHSLRLPAIDEPVFVRARLTNGSSRPPRAVEWRVRLKRP